MTDRITVSFVVDVDPTVDQSARTLVVGALVCMFDDHDLWPTHVAIDVDHNVTPAISAV